MSSLTKAPRFGTVKRINVDIPELIRPFIDAFKNHPRAHSIEHEEVLDDDRYYSLVIQWEVHLASRDLERGHNEVGVNALEPVFLSLPFDLDYSKVSLRLRRDFPRRYLPHINPTPVGDLVYPCLAEYGIQELLYQEGVNGLLTHLEVWLDRAGQGILMDKDQGWEPILFDVTKGALLDTNGRLEHFFSESSMFSNYKTNQHNLWCHFNHIKQADSTFVDAVDNTKSTYSNTPAICLAMPNAEASGQFQNVPVRNSHELYEFLVLLEASKDELKKLKSTFKGIAESGCTDCILIVAIKRPFHLIGSNTNVEIIPFRVVPMANPASKSLVEHLNYFGPCKPAVLRAVSSQFQRESKKVALLGAGSVGSKIAVSLARTGDYSFWIQDNGLLESHNMARHGICGPGSPTGYPKSLMLHESLAGSLGVESSYGSNDLSRGIVGIPLDTDIIIESTGSASVSRNLQSQDFSAQLYQVGLYGEGKLSYLGAEPKNGRRDVRCDDIEAWLYQKGLEDRDVSKLLYEGNNHRRIVVGISCASFTTVMSDPKLNFQASALAERIDTHIHRWTDKLSHGLGSYGIRTTDTGDLTWHRESLSPTKVWSVSHGNIDWEVRLIGCAREQILSQRTERLPNETGGAIIGRIDFAQKVVYVTGINLQPETAVTSPRRFDIDYSYLHRTDQHVLEATVSTLQVLGTWHTHIGSAAASNVDRSTYSDLQDKLNLPFPIMLIAGNNDLEIVNG